MPPVPKPPARRQRRNTRALELVDLSAGDQPAAPKPPTGLLGKTKEAWRSYWLSPVAKAIDMDADLSGIVRLFQLKDERERCYRAIRKNRLVEGSRGQPVINPLYRQIATLDGEIRQLEDRYGLTPLSRAKLGLDIGRGRKTIEELNAALDATHDDEAEEEDPRLALVEQPARDA